MILGKSLINYFPFSLKFQYDCNNKHVFNSTILCILIAMYYNVSI